MSKETQTLDEAIKQENIKKRQKQLDAEFSQMDRTYQDTKPRAKLGPGERKKLVEEKLKYLENAAMVMQNELVSWQKRHAKFFGESLELYKLLNRPDVLYNDSPLSNHTLHRHLRLFLIKKDMAFLAKQTHWFDSPADIPDFLTAIKEIRNWALRFVKDDEPEISGEEKILSQKGGN